MNRESVLFVLLALLFFAPPVLAQKEFGAMQGKVSDVEGSPIPGVTVTASSNSLIGGSSLVYSEDGGQYRLPALAPGTYEVKAELQGFAIVKFKDVRVFVGGKSSSSWVHGLNPARRSARKHAGAYDQRLVLNALEKAKGNYSEAAKLLDVHMTYLYRLLRNLNIKE